MNEKYDARSTEAKWQSRWEEEQLYKADLNNAKNPYFAHVMFPYPSGDKLHVGHWYNFAPADSHSRYMRMQGKDVFTPMGFDAFGLPAENYAIKTGVHPSQSITENVATMTEQLKRIGCMYDWSAMVNTSSPEYYKWTQWLFAQMYKNDLAYKKEAEVNYCPTCQTVLANEQVWDGKCERCSTEVVLKSFNQWYWKTGKYAQELLDGLENLDWPEKTKLMQQNWIGRSEGMNFDMKVKDSDVTFKVYDSVPQTFRAQTFAVIAPEHPMLPELVRGTEHEKEVLEFVEKIKKKKATKRFDIDEDMEGIFTGRYLEFVTGDLPLWVASFVVADYGSGVVNCSAHDERDFAFAKKYDIPLRVVMLPEDEAEAEKVKNFEYCYAKDPQGIMRLPEQFEGRRWGEVRADIIDHLESEGIGERTVQYKLKDWTISRQRYWGAPIPVVYDPEGKPHLIPEEHLPWQLPTDIEFRPDGTAPLARSAELKERTEKLFGKGWTPEVDTMDTFVCSSFYSFMYLAHPFASDGIDPPTGEFISSEIEKKWMPVDMYIGGPEHACMHLIYARFVTKALRDMGHVTTDEPFKRLVHQGLITNQGAKMSKSKGNVVSPDEFIEQYGSDIFRMYLMFMGPFTDGGDWSDTGIKGVERFAQRIWKVILTKASADTTDAKEVLAKLHATIKKVGEDIDRLHFNTALAAMMELINLLEKQEVVSMDSAKALIKILAPMAPHIADELWERIGEQGFVIDQKWPDFDSALLVEEKMTIAIQINGKLRSTIEADSDLEKDAVMSLVKQDEKVIKYLEGQTVRKEIYVPGKLVNFVL